MRVDQNLNSMKKEQQQLNESAENINKAIKKPEENSYQSSEVTPDLIDSIVNQKTAAIAYKANAKSVSVENEVKDSLLNIKA